MNFQAFNITGNASGAQTAIQGVIQDLTKLNDALQNATKTTLSVNEATQKSTAIVNQNVDAYTKLRTVVKESADGTQARTITATTDLLKKQTDAVKELAKATKDAADKNIADMRRSNAQQGEQILRSRFPAPTDGSISSLVNYQRNLDNVIKSLASGKLTAAQFNEVIEKSASGDRNLTGFTTGMNQAYTSVAKLSGAMKEQDDIAKKLFGSGQQLGLTFRNIFNIGEALIFKEILSFITTQISQSVSSAAKLQIQIAEIRTISQESQSTFSDWNKSLTDVSSKLGLDVHDVAGAAYQSLSNQTTQGAKDTEKFLMTAGEFARTTVTSTKDSVDLLSAAMNAFKIPTQDAERVAAVFFKTIDLGRVRGTELANTLGRIAQPAHAIGVSLEETAAGLTVLTRQGVTAHDASTQLLNVFTALLKPTGDLKSLMESWGTPTIEAANATFGFAEVLRRLEEAARGSSTEIAKLFPNIRGIRGAGGLTQGDQFQQYKEDLAAIQNSTAGYDLAKELRAEPAADKLIKEFTKVKNFFINDFGEGLLKFGADFNAKLDDINAKFKNTFGLKDTNNGFQSISESISTLTTLLFKGIEVLGVYYVSWQVLKGVQAAAALGNALFTRSAVAATVSTVDLTIATGANTVATEANTVAKTGNAAAMGGLTGRFVSSLPIIGAVATAAYLLYEQFSDNKKITDQYKNSVDGLVDSIAKSQSTKREDAGKSATDSFAKANAEVFSSMFQDAASRYREVSDQLTELQDKAKGFSNELGIGFSTYTDSLKETIKSFREEIDAADASIQNSKRGMLSFSDTMDAVRLKAERRKGSEYQQNEIDEREIARLKAKGEALAQSGDPEQAKKLEAIAVRIAQIREDQDTRSDQRRLTQAKNDYDLYQKQQPASVRRQNAADATNTDPGSKNFGKVIIPVQTDLNALESAITESENLLKRWQQVNEDAQKRRISSLQTGEADAKELLRRQVQLIKERNELNGGFEKDGTTVKKEFRVSASDSSLDPEKLAKKTKELDDQLKKNDAEGRAKINDNRTSLLKNNRDNEKKFMDDSVNLFKLAEDQKTAILEAALKAREKARIESNQVQIKNESERRQKEFNVARDTVTQTPGRLYDKGGTLDKIEEVVNALAKVSEENLISRPNPGSLIRQLTVPPSDKDKEVQRAFELSGQSNEANKSLQQQFQQLKSDLIANKDDPTKRTEILSTMKNLIGLMEQNLVNEQNAKRTVDLNNNTSRRPAQIPEKDSDVGPLRIQQTNTSVGQALEEANKQLTGFTTALERMRIAEETIAKLKDSNASKEALIDYTKITESQDIIKNFSILNFGADSNLGKSLTGFATQLANLSGLLSALKNPGANANIPNLQGDNGNPFSGADRKARGGMVGGPKGIDVIPTWLTAGEYVMPVAQTMAFLPLLKAMHMGRLPHGAGGNVSTTVGDINITIQGTPSNDKNVRKIGEELRREIRRGNVSLN